MRTKSARTGLYRVWMKIETTTYADLRITNEVKCIEKQVLFKYKMKKKNGWPKVNCQTTDFKSLLLGITLVWDWNSKSPHISKFNRPGVRNSKNFLAQLSIFRTTANLYQFNRFGRWLSTLQFEISVLKLWLLCQLDSKGMGRAFLLGVILDWLTGKAWSVR